MSAALVLADDLTGALDAGVAFARPDAPLSVHLDLPLVLDDGAVVVPTRERTAAEAVSAVDEAARRLRPSGLVFKKIDSLLRGHWAAELAVLMRSGRFRRCVLAPAFPAQGRITADGRQWRRHGDGGHEALGGPLVDVLGGIGLGAARWRPGDVVRADAAVLVVDAATDGGLAAAVAAGRTLDGPVLWCGTGGLAQALGGPPPVVDRLRAPLLGLVGTVHPTTLGQLDALARRYPDTVVPVDDGMMPALAGHAAAVLTFPVEPTNPAVAAAVIERRLAGVLARIDTPRTLFVTGGETLLATARALGASRLEVDAAFAAGVPWSRLCGGRWDGVTVLSKSGAFGAEDLLVRIVDAALSQPDCF